MFVYKLTGCRFESLFSRLKLPSHGILHYRKAYLNWLCQYLSFLNIFFNRFCPVEKGGVTPNCLYHDSLTLRNNTLHDLIALTQNVKSLEEHISNCRPWHVIECCCVVVDLYRMKPRGDLFIDGWNWNYSKTYIAS